MNVFRSENRTLELFEKKHIYQGLNAAEILMKSTHERKIYYPGLQCRCQERVHMPTSDDAPGGDG